MCTSPLPIMSANHQSKHLRSDLIEGRESLWTATLLCSTYFGGFWEGGEGNLEVDLGMCTPQVAQRVPPVPQETMRLQKAVAQVSGPTYLWVALDKAAEVASQLCPSQI